MAGSKDVIKPARIQSSTMKVGGCWPRLCSIFLEPQSSCRFVLPTSHDEFIASALEKGHNLEYLSHRSISLSIMKLLSSALLLALAAYSPADAFVPSSLRPSPAFSSSTTELYVATAKKAATKKPAAKKSKTAATEPAAKADVTEDEIRHLFNLWNEALATGEPSLVAKRYSKNAVLLPTVSDEPRMDAKGIEDYFVNFLKNEPQGEIKQGKIHMGDGWANDSGIYEFTFGTTGAKVKARYSYVYVKEDGAWKILHHHSR